MTAGALKTRFLAGRYCKNHVFAKIVFWSFENRFFVFFGGPGDSFSDLFCLGNKLESETIFSDKPDLNKWIWLGRFVGIWAL